MEESGWKNIHSEVFRFPPNKNLFCALVGSGYQVPFLCPVHTHSLAKHLDRNRLVNSATVVRLDYSWVAVPWACHMHDVIQACCNKILGVCAFAQSS